MFLLKRVTSRNTQEQFHQVGRFYLLSVFAIERLEPGSLHRVSKYFIMECTQLSGYLNYCLQVAVLLSFRNRGAPKSESWDVNTLEILCADTFIKGVL